MYTGCEEPALESMGIKAARERFCRLVDATQRGRAVTITRRGKAVAQVALMPAAKRARLPDLTAFRSALGKPPKRSVAATRHLPDVPRY